MKKPIRSTSSSDSLRSTTIPSPASPTLRGRGAQGSLTSCVKSPQKGKAHFGPSCEIPPNDDSTKTKGSAQLKRTRAQYNSEQDCPSPKVPKRSFNQPVLGKATESSQAVSYRDEERDKRSPLKLKRKKSLIVGAADGEFPSSSDDVDTEAVVPPNSVTVGGKACKFTPSDSSPSSRTTRACHDVEMTKKEELNLAVGKSTGSESKAKTDNSSREDSQVTQQVRMNAVHNLTDII